MSNRKKGKTKKNKNLDNKDNQDVKEPNQNQDSENTEATPDKTKKDQSGTLISLDDMLPHSALIVPLYEKPAFPGMMVPINITNEELSKVVAEYIEEKNDYVGIMYFDGDQEDDITPDMFQEIGVIGKVVKKVNLPDGGINILVNTLKRFRIKKIISSSPPVNIAGILYPSEIPADKEEDLEVKALLRNIIELVRKISKDDNFMSEQIKLTMANIDEPGILADYVTYVLNLNPSEHQDVLEEFDVKERLKKVHNYVLKEIRLVELQQKIKKQIEDKVAKQQKEYFLKEQLKVIKSELGMEDDPKVKEVKDMEKKLKKLKLPKDVKERVNREFEKFKAIERVSHEHTVIRNYLELITELPWGKYSKENLDVEHAEKILNEDHFGLEDVKERILEFIAVRKLKKDVKGSIICLVGPPGTGKTSLGKSIARALNRKFQRFSLGGMRDEAEIKGHRRTYVGAMPGKIINSLKIAKTSNPVLMLDEVDKLGKGFQGDPASALLEVLDPEQNDNFVDHYLDLPYDLSQVLFITTANTLDTIPRPLLDRMEVIRLAGYIDEEKYNIGKKFLLPKQLKRHGLTKDDVKLDKESYLYLVNKYAREAGVRNFERMLEKLCRKVATLKAKAEEGEKTNIPDKITVDVLKGWLGPEKFRFDEEKRITKPGMIIGLAWTPLGGDTLTVESTALPTQKGSFKITGQIGNVMNESASIAYSYVKSVSKKHGLDPDFFDKNLIHIHVPAGATPKDGPSAGITIASAIMSLAKDKMSKKNVAMTGELTLVGNVLPIGGLREKVVAAKRVGIKDVIYPKDNEKDLLEIPEYIRKGITFHPVENVEDVFEIAIRKT
jgi:ATP-dependent Lon protease